MSDRVIKILTIAFIWLATVLLFTAGDYFVHSLSPVWSVPEYYFSHKIIYGWLWGVAGLLLARWFSSLWLKALVLSGVVVIALQVRYFVEGYPLDFVLWFLLFHFIILYVLTIAMFWIFNRAKINY